MRAFCTIATPSHCNYAFALAESLREAGNPETLYVLLIGGAIPVDANIPQNMRMLTLDDLPKNYPALMLYYYSAFELCNALKPYLVRHLLQQAEIGAVIFLDSDLLITHTFYRVWAALNDTTLLLTPHHYEPPPLDSQYTNEVDVIDLGFLNGGFAAWRAGPRAQLILDWMCERFAVYGFYRYLGMAADQKLLPLVLAYFPDEVRISPDRGLNIAYWNAHERPVEHNERRYQIGDEPVIFFHMSGCKLSHPHLACAYVSPAANDILFQRAPWLRAVTADYLKLIERHQPSDEWTKAGYAYECFDGVKLNPAYRQLLFKTGKLDRGDRRFWMIWLTVRARMIKRLLTGVRPLS